MLKMDNQTILLAFAVVTGLAIVMQTLMLFIVFVAMRKAAKAVGEEAEKLRASIMPVLFDARDLLANTQGTLANAQALLATTQGFVARMTPKVEAATADIVEIAHRLRDQSVVMQSTTLEIADRVRSQSVRVDHMFSTVLDTIDYAGEFVVDAVRKPVRQASGILRSVKAIVQSLRTPVQRG